MRILTPCLRNCPESREIALRDVNRYPDEQASVLTDALRIHYGDYSFVCGVGMDGVIETVIRTLVDPGEQVVISDPTFSFYGLAATGQGAEIISVPRAKNFSVDPENLNPCRQAGKSHDRLFS